MDKNQVKLVPLEDNDRKQFISDNQKAFLYGAVEEFGLRDDHFEEDGEIISPYFEKRNIHLRVVSGYNGK